jgi:hypothetical protein
MTINSLSLFKSLLHTRSKKPSASRNEAASSGNGVTYEPDHLAVFCRKFSPCFRGTVVSWSKGPAYSTKETVHDSRSTTWLATDRHPGDDSKSCCGAGPTSACSEQTGSPRAGQNSGKGSRQLECAPGGGQFQAAGVLILELYRAQISERGVEPACVVDGVDEAWVPSLTAADCNQLRDLAERVGPCPIEIWIGNLW